MENNLVQIQKRFTSRSAVLSYLTCPYKRYLTYHYNGYGITPSNESLNLIIGTVVHRGLQHLLEHCRKHRADEQLTIDCINEAVEVARELWQDTLSKKDLWLHSGEFDRLDWIIAEQECLWEGLIRAWAIRRLPEILDQYIILEVEKEEVYEDFTPLVTCPNIDWKHHYPEKCSADFVLEEPCQTCGGSGYHHPVIFLGKADGLFLGKPGYPTEGKIVQLSIKTASTFPEVTLKNIQHDMQGVSEQVCTNDRLLEKLFDAFVEGRKTFTRTGISDDMFHYFVSCDHKNIRPEVYAVQYEFLLKGQRKQDPYNSGIYKQQSFLCHPYKLDSIMTLSGQSIGFTPTSYKWKVKQGKQPAGWNKADIWDDIGIQNWVEMLAMGKVQPEEGDPLAQILVTPGLIIRLPEEIEEWKVSTAFREEEIARHLDEMEELERRFQEAKDEDLKESLAELLQVKKWQYFPKNTQSCHDFYGEDCQYVNHCHELADLTTLEESGLMQPRTPHHDLEKEYFLEKGFINE